jgi:hypothetical protein
MSSHRGPPGPFVLPGPPSQDPVRRCPHLPLPSVPFIAGQTDRPAAAFAATLDTLDDSVCFAWGCDLFDAGCFFEAHEAWEGPWRRARDRASTSTADQHTATLLQALIKVAAAAVKARQGSAVGRDSHLRGVTALLQSLEGPTPPGAAYGLSVAVVQAAATAVHRDEAPRLPATLGCA